VLMTDASTQKASCNVLGSTIVLGDLPLILRVFNSVIVSRQPVLTGQLFRSPRSLGAGKSIYSF
jgi:hypothetical protein